MISVTCCAGSVEREPFRHDHGREGIGLAEQIGEQSERPLQAELQHGVGYGGQVVHLR